MLETRVGRNVERGVRESLDPCLEAKLSSLRLAHRQRKRPNEDAQRSLSSTTMKKKHMFIQAPCRVKQRERDRMLVDRGAPGGAVNDDAGLALLYCVVEIHSTVVVESSVLDNLALTKATSSSRVTHDTVALIIDF